MSKNKNVFVVVSIDGIITLECGIGIVVADFFDNICQFDYFDNRDIFAISPDVCHTSADYRQDIFRKVANVCAVHNGDILTYAVPDNSSLKNAWGLQDIQNWQNACVKTAELIKGIAQSYDTVTVVVHGIMLANVRSYISNPNVQIIFVAHSLGMAGNDALAQQRIDWEEKGFFALQQYSMDKIAYVSYFTKALLERNYAVDSQYLIPCLNGVWTQNPKYNISEHTQQQTLQSYGIQDDIPLLFSWGRCVPSKHFDKIIDGWARFCQQHPDATECLVLLMPSAVVADAYKDMLMDKIRGIPSHRIRAVFDFSDTLPISMLKHKNLKTVIFASEFESYMLTAAESLAFCAKDVQHVFYSIPPLEEQYAHMDNAHRFTTYADTEIVDVIKQSLHSTHQGSNTPPDFVNKMRQFLKCII